MRDDTLKQILFEKENKVLPDNFDDNLIKIIKEHASVKATEKRYIRLMYLFFLLGLILGLIIANGLVNYEFTLFDKVFTIQKHIISIPLIFVLLFVFEKIYRATLVSRGKEKTSEI